MCARGGISANDPMRDSQTTSAFPARPSTRWGPTGAVAVDSRNNVWVGSNGGHRFGYYDGWTGELLDQYIFANLPGEEDPTGGYGGLVDCHDVLWTVGRPFDEPRFRRICFGSSTTS